MSDANTLVQQAKKAYTAGDKAKAKEFLLKAVDLDEHNEQAWMWMSAVVSSMEEQQICLENVLSINPNNEKARKGLEAIQKKLGKPAAPPPSSSAAVPPKKKTDIFAEIDFNEPGNPFTTDHGWGDQAPGGAPPAPAPAGWGDPGSAPSAPSGWGDIDTGASSEPSGWGDVNTGAPSSGWGDESPPAPAAYGSGKQVERASGAELDDWISNMGIGSPAGTPSSSPFDLSAPAPAANDPFGGVADTGDPWANTGDNIWGGAENDPWANPGSSAPVPASPAPAAPVSDDPWSSVSDPFGSSRSTARPAAPAPASKSDVFSDGDKPFDGTITDLFAGSDPFADSDAPAASRDPFGGVSIYDNEPAPPSKPASSKKAAIPAPMEPASFDFGSEDEFVFDEDGSFFDDRPAKQPVKSKAKAQPAKASSKSAAASEFEFGEDDADFSDPFAELDEKPAKRGKAAATLSPNYDLIPEELRGGGGGGRGLMVAAAVLALLNLAALAGVFIAM